MWWKQKRLSGGEDWSGEEGGPLGRLGAGVEAAGTSGVGTFRLWAAGRWPTPGEGHPRKGTSLFIYPQVSWSG